MNNKKLPVKKSGNQVDTVQASESDPPLSKAQLLSVIEFSRQFPELTLHLATVRHDEDEEKLAPPQVSSDEPLEFPPLVVPDPREINPRLSGDSDEAAEHEASEDEFALFAAGRLPPPEPAGKQKEQKKKKKIWKLLLPLTLFLLFLFWLHEVDFRSIR